MSRGRFVDLTGQRFNKLRVLGRAPDLRPGVARWNCLCDCGNSTITGTSNLKGGTTFGCGCVQMDSAKRRILPFGRAAANRLFARYKQGAKKRGLAFELSLRHFLAFTSAVCHYCGSAPEKEERHEPSVYKYNGIDRKDNTKGYLLDNCLPCCWKCNNAKGSLSYQDFLEMITKISRNLRGV